MKIVALPALFTLLAIGAVAAEYSDDDFLGYLDLFRSQHNQNNDQNNAPPVAKSQEQDSSEEGSSSAENEVVPKNIIRPCLTQKPVARPSLTPSRISGARLSLIQLLIRAQFLLRKELRKAKQQQFAQKKLVSDLESFIRIQSLLRTVTQRIESAMQVKLHRLRAEQAQRLDEETTPIAQTPSQSASKSQPLIQPKTLSQSQVPSQSQSQSQPKSLEEWESFIQSLPQSESQAFYESQLGRQFLSYLQQSKLLAELQQLLSGSQSNN
ncbi:accessory gland protein Acp36DE-like [Drosophila kikkawai]|uniref:Accessory gland protein Acp36DE-like n=1 Tax=Drosophila kikkawai TaxID=30033 RepID=A0A6P4ICV8_DROKI|nr:uncharacterized protein LOC108077300 [Drosophila kikkawai]